MLRCRLGWRVHCPMRARLLRRGRRSHLRPYGASTARSPTRLRPLRQGRQASPATTGFVWRLGRPASGTVMPKSSEPVLNDAWEAVGLSIGFKRCGLGLRLVARGIELGQIVGVDIGLQRARVGGAGGVVPLQVVARVLVSCSVFDFFTGAYRELPVSRPT